MNRTEHKDNHVIGDMVRITDLCSQQRTVLSVILLLPYCVATLFFCSPKGSIILDPDFDIFQEMGHLCKICKAVSANTQLVKPGGAQCLPSGKTHS